jgi:hypothetical protein
MVVSLVSNADQIPDVQDSATRTVLRAAAADPLAAVVNPSIPDDPKPLLAYLERQDNRQVADREIDRLFTEYGLPAPKFDAFGNIDQSELQIVNPAKAQSPSAAGSEFDVHTSDSTVSGEAGSATGTTSPNGPTTSGFIFAPQYQHRQSCHRNDLILLARSSSFVRSASLENRGRFVHEVSVG